MNFKHLCMSRGVNLAYHKLRELNAQYLLGRLKSTEHDFRSALADDASL